MKRLNLSTLALIVCAALAGVVMTGFPSGAAEASALIDQALDRATGAAPEPMLEAVTAEIATLQTSTSTTIAAPAPAPEVAAYCDPTERELAADHAPLAAMLETDRAMTGEMPDAGAIPRS